MPHWLVIDLEATTDEGGWPVTEMEIIEIGATLVDRAGREQDHFQRFVKPTRRPLLTPFCRELTHITQANIDAAQPLNEVWPAFERWLGQHRTRLEGWASWGDYDRKQLLRGMAAPATRQPAEPGATHEPQAAFRQGPAPGTTAGLERCAATGRHAVQRSTAPSAGRCAQYRAVAAVGLATLKSGRELAGHAPGR